MATAPQTAHDKKAALQKQIEELQKKVQDLNQEAVHELKLKLSEARKIVRSLEAQLEELTGKSSSATPKIRRPRRASVSDDILRDMVIKALAAHGKEGMNAKQMAEQIGQDPMRVRKFISSNPKTLKRTGAGPGTKFFLP